MKNVMIFEEDKEKLSNVLPEDYTLNDNNILLNKGVPLDYNDNPVKEILKENNIRTESAIFCKDCENWTTNYYTVYTRGGDSFYVCGDCSQDYFYCEDCGDLFDDTVDTYTTHDERDICEFCRNDYYFECCDCNDIYHEDHMHYCDDCDRAYCDNCWDDHYKEHHEEDSLLYDYHEFTDWRLKKTPEEPTPEFYIGHELEIDDGHDMREAVDIINSIDGVCMHDGSLNDEGIEFISHPMSYNYMLSQEEKYKKAFEELSNNCGYKSHNTTTCGLHFHVTKPRDSKIIDRIILFMETYKEEIISLSRRKRDELNRWSRFLSDKKQGTNPKVIKSLDYIVNNKDFGDRYMALNLTNYNTIEFRFFKGTLKYETFMADFEFVNNLVHFASDLTIPVEELTWTLVTSVGKFLPNYVNEHNLQSDRPIVDYSKENLVKFNEDKTKVRIEADNLIAEILKAISNKARTKNNTSQKLKVTSNLIYKYNEEIQRLYYIVYELENLDIFNYDKLTDLKSTIKSIKERVGK